MTILSTLMTEVTNLHGAGSQTDATCRVVVRTTDLSTLKDDMRKVHPVLAKQFFGNAKYDTPEGTEERPDSHANQLLIVSLADGRKLFFGVSS